MSRPKEITATAAASTLIMPLANLSIVQLIDASTTPGLQIPAQVVQTVNEVAVPNLEPDWPKHVFPCFDRSLAGDEVARLESVLKAYVRGRVTVTNPITWKDFESRLDGFAQISRALLNEFDNLGPAYTLAWSKIVESSESLTGKRLSRDDIYQLVSALHGASVRAGEGARERRQAGVKGDRTGPWIELIVNLAKLFEDAGGQATAAKSRRDCSYAPPSRFVALVLAIMHKAVPEQLREHNHSEGAMADAVSDALSKRHQWRGYSLQFVVE